jgi:hypothetical protein
MGNDITFWTDINSGNRKLIISSTCKPVSYTLIFGNECNDEMIDDMKETCDFSIVHLDIEQRYTSAVFAAIVKRKLGKLSWHNKRYVLAQFGNQQHATESITTLKLTYSGVYLTSYKTSVKQILAMHNTVALKAKLETMKSTLTQLEREIPRLSKDICKVYKTNYGTDGVHELSGLRMKCDQDATLLNILIRGFRDRLRNESME